MVSGLEGNFDFIFFWLGKSEVSEYIKVNFHCVGILRENNKFGT
jgi:hypothetical protein